MKRGWWSDLLLLLAGGLLLRFGLLMLFPEPYGNDSIGRLYFSDSLFLSHWLPLTQVLVWCASRLSEEIWGVRVLFAAIGAASAIGFYAYLRQIVSRSAALAGGVLFTFNGLYVLLSLMPYQGPLFLGLYYAAAAVLFRPPELQSATGGLLYGLASLTRYESWFGLPFLAVWKIRRELTGGGVVAGFQRALTAGVYLGWAPLLWFGLSFVHWGDWTGFLFQGPGQSFYGWHPHFDLPWVLDYLGRFGYWIASFASPLVLLALWGIWRLLQGAVPNAAGVKVLVANALTVVLFFAFVIGQEQGTVFRFVLFPMSVVLVLAALGMDELFRRLPRYRVPVAALIAAMALLLASAAGVRVYRVTQEPVHRDPYRIVRFLKDNLNPGETALVVAQRSRDPNEAAPMGFQRIVAISKALRSQVISSGLLQERDPAKLEALLESARVRYLIRYRRLRPWVASDVYFNQLPESFPGRFEMALDTQLAQVFEVIPGN